MVTSARLCGIFSATLLVVEGDTVAATMYGSSAPFEVTGRTVPVGALLIVDQENASGTLVGVPIADQGLVGIAFNSGCGWGPGLRAGWKALSGDHLLPLGGGLRSALRGRATGSRRCLGPEPRGRFARGPGGGPRTHHTLGEVRWTRSSS